MSFSMEKAMTSAFSSKLLAADFSKFMSKSVAALLPKALLAVSKHMTRDLKRRAKNEIKIHKKVAKSLAPVLGGMLDFVGIVLQILDSMGVLEPIMSIFNSVLQIIGGAILEGLVPALGDMADQLFSDEMMDNWKQLGDNASNILIPVLVGLTKIIMVWGTLGAALGPASDALIIFIKV